MIGRDVLDDRQPESGAAGGARTCLVDPEEPLEHPLLVSAGDADPRSVTAISMLSPQRRRLIDTADPGGEYAMPLEIRLASAVTSSVWSPNTRKPLGASVVTSMSALSAATLLREIASATTVSMSTAPRSGSLSAPWSRDSSMSSPTMLANRLDSASTLDPNRRTVSGSSAAASSASAKHTHGTDRCLQFVADIGHEIAPGGFHPGVLGLVVGVEHREPAILLGQQPDVAAHRQRRAPRWAGLALRQIDFAALAGHQRALGGHPGPVVEQPIVHQTKLRRPVIHEDHVAMGVDDDHAERGSGDDVLQHLRNRDAGLLGGGPLPALPDAGRRHGPDHHPHDEEDPGDDQRRHHAHAKIVRRG